MEQISLPSQITAVATGQNQAQITISPCYPGYGTTLGNALRRVLLSSLPGSAITAVKIKGVDHEFSSLENVKEDIVEIILNLKNVRLKVIGDEPQELELIVKGEKIVTAKDFKKNSQVKIVNPEQVIATITDKNTEFQMKVLVNSGRGYVPVENREKEKLDIGFIAIDAIYTPLKTVNFNTVNVRVGQQTNYDQLILDIATDGSLAPTEAFQAAAKILVEHFNLLSTTELAQETTKKKRKEPKEAKVKTEESAAETAEPKE